MLTICVHALMIHIYASAMVQRSLAGPIFSPLVFTHHHPSPHSSLSRSSSSSPSSSYSSPSPYFHPAGELISPNFPVGQPIQHVARYPENKIRFSQVDQFSLFHMAEIILRRRWYLHHLWYFYLIADFSYCSLSFYTRKIFCEGI